METKELEHIYIYIYYISYLLLSCIGKILNWGYIEPALNEQYTEVRVDSVPGIQRAPSVLLEIGSFY